MVCFTVSSVSWRFLKAAAAWVFIVFLYSGVYLWLWYGSVDSFIINKEFNLNPIEVVRNRLFSGDGSSLWLVDTPARIPLSTDLDGMMSVVAQMDATAVDIEKSLIPLRAEQEQLDKDVQQLIKIQSDRTSSRMNEFSENSTSAERKEVDRLEGLVEVLEKSFGSNPPAERAIVLADARVELAQARYNEAVKSAQVAQEVLTNIGRFVDLNLDSGLSKIRDDVEGNLKNQQNLLEKLRGIRAEAYEKFKSWSTGRRERLEWVDFLYFSVGVSTSTTFGDITPNSRYARIAALSQLVLCVFLLGYLVSLAGPVHKSNKA